MLFSKINDLQRTSVQIHGIFLIACHGFCLSKPAGLSVAFWSWQTVRQTVIDAVAKGQKRQKGIVKSEVIEPGNHFRIGKYDAAVTMVTEGHKM
ncbi:hypothetical protein [Chromobacterium vaccinii]|uniref:Uncharacterized protein n=1 Tax=Chromobacterium vaccinii TaxID=1108595 RepID=A0A1D9LCF2_9NEIS|nr:hypothetical protein [Chromobacterium vaccinii]AOZ48864.1 hypothetical protein BKX93_01870 [Chromobacterium vaccinii]